MKTIQLDEEANRYLDELISQQSITGEELIKQLLLEHLSKTKKSKTVLQKLEELERQLEEAEESKINNSLADEKPKTVMERLKDAEKSRGRPRHFLQGRPDLSDRDVRRALIAEHVENQQRKILIQAQESP